MTKNKVGLFINDNILSTIFFKKIITDNIIDVEFVIIEQKKKNKNYLFSVLLYKDFYIILKNYLTFLIKNENVKSICKSNNIFFINSKKLSENTVIDTINKSHVKNIFFINIYNKLNINRFHKGKNFINIHLGDTNKYRGVFCLIHSIINKEKYFYITSHFIIKEFDKGKIIYQKKIKIFKESVFNIYLNLFLKKSDVIYESLNSIQKLKFKENKNTNKIYRPPNFLEIYIFFKSLKKYSIK